MNLNEPSAFASVDTADALGAVEATADQWAAAVARARAFADLPAADGISNIIYCGMGGSGIAGDVLAALAIERGSVPVTVVKGYTLPAFAGLDSLVIATSYSGNTEETLACVEAARAANARIVGISTGGALAGTGIPVLTAPAGLQPRAAMATLTVSTLVIAERLGILPDISDDLAETEDVLRVRCKELGRDVADNPAKRLAQGLDGVTSLTWGQEGMLAVAATRWRCQLNENAKVPAFGAVLPELDHNEIVGYDPGVPGLSDLALIVLRQPAEHPRITRRIDATLEAMRDRVGAVHEVPAFGTSSLARLMSSCIMGDFTSVYLALLRGVDPSPVHVIENLKRRLA